MFMDRKRVFKTKTFDRWARKVVGDNLLSIAAREIEAGIFDAGLGHGLCKKRIATPGHGKRGAAIIFLRLRPQSAPDPAEAAASFCPQPELRELAVRMALKIL